MTRSAVDAFCAAVVAQGSAFTFPPDALIARLDLAAAAGNTAENVERAAREVVDRSGSVDQDVRVWRGDDNDAQYHARVRRVAGCIGSDGAIHMVTEGQPGRVDTALALDTKRRQR